MHIPPPKKCRGFLYTVESGDSLFLIARRFGISLQALIDANPQIPNPDLIFPGQKICIPKKKKKERCPRIKSVRFLDGDGNPLPMVGPFVQLERVTIIRVRTDIPITSVFFFLTPTGVDVFEFTELIGLIAVDADTVAEFIWEVPDNVLGFLFVHACFGSCCGVSEEMGVFFEGDDTVDRPK